MKKQEFAWLVVFCSRMVTTSINFTLTPGYVNNGPKRAALVLVAPIAMQCAIFCTPNSDRGQRGHHHREQRGEGRLHRLSGSGPRDYAWCKVSKSPIWQMPGASNLMQLSITDKRKSKLLIKRNKSLFASLAKRTTALDITPPSSLSATGITMQCSWYARQGDLRASGKGLTEVCPALLLCYYSSCAAFEGCLFLRQPNDC